VRIRIPVGTTKDALFVPDEAIGSKQGGRTLLVVNAQDVVEHGVVGLGAKQGDWRVITPGLTQAIASSSTACSESAPGKRLRLTIVLRNPPTRSRARAEAIMSKFFVERPVFAKVLALVIHLIGGVSLCVCQCHNTQTSALEALTRHPASRSSRAYVNLGREARQAIPPHPVLRRYLPPPAADVPAAAETQTAAARCSAWPVSARTGLTGARADLLHASDPAGNVRRAEQGVVFSWT